MKFYLHLYLSPSGAPTLTYGTKSSEIATLKVKKGKSVIRLLQLQNRLFGFNFFMA